MQCAAGTPYTGSLRACLGVGFRKARGSDSTWRTRMFAMPIPLRSDFAAAQVRGFAKRAKDGPQARRLLALAAIYDGATRTQAAAIGGVTLQIVRDWVVKFNAHGPDGLIDRKAPGQPSRLNDTHRAALATMIESGPIPAVHGVVRWRLIDLCQWLFEEFRITVAKQTLSRELRAMGYRKLSARPRHHAQAEGAVEDFKKASRRAWTRSRGWWSRQTSRAAAVQVPGAKPGREYLAVHARQLAVKPHLHVLQRPPRPLLCSLEQARRPALAHHDHRPA